MDLDVGKSELLYIGSSILGAISVTIFSTGDSVLSPVTKIAIMGLISGLFLLFGTYTQKKLETMLLYGLGAFTYIVGALYTVTKFDIGSDGSFLILALSAAIFAGLGHLITEGRKTLPRNKLRIGAAVILLLGLSVTLFDLSSPQVNYSTNLESEINLTETRETQVGTLLVQNNFMLPRSTDIPSYEACVYTPDRREASVHVDGEYKLDLIAGGTVEELDLNIRAHPRQSEEEPEELGTFKVERAEDCPESSEQNKIVITETEN